MVTRFRDEGTGEFFSPDYAAMARAMGAEGVRVTRPGALKKQLAAALESGRPCVLDVRVEADVKPLVEPNTVVYMPPGVKHGIWNTGFEDLVMIVLAVPARDMPSS